MEGGLSTGGRANWKAAAGASRLLCYVPCSKEDDVFYHMVMTNTKTEKSSKKNGLFSVNR